MNLNKLGTQDTNLYQNKIQFPLFLLCVQEEEFLSKNNTPFLVNHLKM